MTDKLRLYILAGEPSGDRIAAELVGRLREKVELEVAGVGGEALSAQGLNSQFDMTELSVMGFADVLPRLPKLLWRARQVANAIVRMRPDIAVLVDSQVFAAIVAKRVHHLAPHIPVVLYVAPAVWAWKPERARHLNPHFREVLSVLPFEPAFMDKMGGPPTHYVGHPAIHTFKPRTTTAQSGQVLLLPGSRPGELRRHLPLMRNVAIKLAPHPRVSGFVLPTPKRLKDLVEREVSTWPVPVNVVTGEPAKLAAFDDAIVAVAVTGTVTLELALAGVPMVTTYLADKGQAKRWFKYKVKFAALPNVLLDRALVPEILQIEPEPAKLVDAATLLLDDQAAQSEQLTGFSEIRRLMEDGAVDTPRLDAAERILKLVG